MSEAHGEGDVHELVLYGCRSVPLACYLKALGVLRLVGEQKDARARGHWRGDTFILRTVLDRAGLEQFFLEEYQPTPIIGPWGARSGFYPEASEKSAREALREIESADGPRLEPFVAAIRGVRKILGTLGVVSKKDVAERKHALMEVCRARLDDRALPWLDACFTLLGDDERFPPLLGTGGNEGSGSYMSGFAQQVASCVVRRECDSAVAAALWDAPRPGVAINQTPGHFLPAAGGANAATGFGDDPAVNPWDYLLCIEGALCLASAAARSLEADPASRRASSPFTVESTPSGYASAAIEKNRGELWFPIWGEQSAATASEVRMLFSEGRATVGGRRVRNGIEFARAIASLGVDRGIERFVRFGIQERNGQNNIATALGSYDVVSRSRVQSLQEVDGWLDRFRRSAGSDKAPAAARRALWRLDSAVMALCERGDARALLEVLIALGGCERVMARSPRWVQDAYLAPVPPLSPRWLAQCDDGSVELRLAASVASVRGNYGTHDGRRVTLWLRQQLEPVAMWSRVGALRVGWDFEAGRDVAWGGGHLERSLNACAHRRVMRAVQAGGGCRDSGHGATLGDLADFIEGRVDDGRLGELIWGCSLVDWLAARRRDLPDTRGGMDGMRPCALYSLLRLCYPPADSELSEAVPVVPRIHRLASQGDGMAAAREAIARLRASGLSPALGPFQVDGEVARRSAAAVLFPVHDTGLRVLSRAVLRPGDVEGGDGDEASHLHTRMTDDNEGASA